jgi:AcrR family transcriptional regulator
MDDIVAESGLSKGGVYWHFKSKRELLIAAIMDAFGGSPDELMAPLLESSASAAEKLGSLLEVFTQMIVSGPLRETMPLILESWAQNVRDPEIQELSMQLFEQYRRPLAQLIEAGIAAGELKPVSAMAMASILIAVYDGLTVQWMSAPTAIDWEVIRETLEKTLIAGLAEKG